MSGSRWGETPQIFLIAETATVDIGVAHLLEAIGAAGWSTGDNGKPYPNDACELTEIAGRICYKSFAPGLNLNVTKVREGNTDYIGNILKQRHGSVLEHSYVTFALLGVSRVFTHEIVRHRPGMAYSQESLRYVRLEEWSMAQSSFLETPKIRSAAQRVMDAVDDFVNYVTEELNLNEEKDFHVKKTITSAMRRMMPQGMATNIVITGNHRAWRHLIEVRTSEGAEEEIRNVMRAIWVDLKTRYPAIYQDSELGPHGEVEFAHSKV